MLHDSKDKVQAVVPPYPCISPTEIQAYEQGRKKRRKKKKDHILIYMIWLLVQFVTNIPKRWSHSEASFLTAREYELVRGNMGCEDKQVWERFVIVNKACMKVTICWEVILTCKILSKHEWRTANPTHVPGSSHNQIWPPWNFSLN